MSKFYSSLIINSKNFPTVHQVFKPLYNKVFFKRITANIDQLESNVEKRCKYSDAQLSKESLNSIKKLSSELVRLRERLEKLGQDGLERGDPRYQEVLTKLEQIEDCIMPTITAIPNRYSKQVPKQDEILEQIESDFLKKENITKTLSHRKLSYINSCYSKSVVGPNSHYYYGIGAKLQHGLSDYFVTKLEGQNFVPVSGLCLTKSAVVEASNSKDSKDYFRDPCRILTENHQYTTLHLVESSREALLGFVTTLGHMNTNEPLRLVTNGASYRAGSNWFDGDENRVTQLESAHALVLNSSIESYSMKEYISVRDTIWNCYRELELPTRLIHCSLDSMFSNEYDAHRIEIWLPSLNDWIPVSRISHYLDYISVRSGIRRGHLIDSTVYDGQALAAAIIENKQTSSGKFIIPEVLHDHVLQLDNEEQVNYTRSSINTATSVARTAPKVLVNHEQRRYLVKKKFYLSHSRKAEQIRRKNLPFYRSRYIIAVVMLFAILLDWGEIWKLYIPDIIRAVIYDYIYRPSRRLIWMMSISREKWPEDKPWRMEDKTGYELTTNERRMKKILELRDKARPT